MFLRNVIRIILCLVAFSVFCAAQEELSLGEVARRERARKAAEKAAAEAESASPAPAPAPAVPPVAEPAPTPAQTEQPAAVPAPAATAPEAAVPPARPVKPLAPKPDEIPAQFLRFDGEVGQGGYAFSINGQPVLRNQRIPGLPVYVSPLLKDGANVLEVQFTSDARQPMEIVIEERYPSGAPARELARFQALAGQFPEQTIQQVEFTAHPRAIPNVQLTEKDRADIIELIKHFHETLTTRVPENVTALFGPAIDAVRGIYPEGANFAHREMTNLGEVTQFALFKMEPFDPEGLEFQVRGNVATVYRQNGNAVLRSNEVTGPINGSVGNSRVDARVVPVKKIDGVWQLTLPFGF